MNSELRNKITGAIIGYAIGDALGLSTELMTREEAWQHYPEGVNDYQDMVLDAHRNQWGAGNYSHDTFYVSMLIDNIVCNGGIDTASFAQTLKEWYGDGHYDISTHFRVLLTHPDYVNRPESTAKEIFRRMGHLTETGGVLGMALVAGMASDDPTNEPEKLTGIIEAGPLAQATTHIIGITSHDILWNNHIPTPDQLIAAARNCSGDIDSTIEAAAREDGIKDLQVDDEDEMWLTTKCAGTALWALWHYDSFEEAIKKVIMLGGDADTNAALTGALFGLKLGINGIPEIWKKGLLKYNKIEATANRFADYLIKKHNEIVNLS